MFIYALFWSFTETADLKISSEQLLSIIMYFFSILSRQYYSLFLLESVYFDILVFFCPLTTSLSSFF